MTAESGPLRVLVVDDEPAIRRFLRAGLSSQGYVVSELDQGLPAVDAARRKAADLIVLTRWIWAPTIMSPSRSASTNSLPGSGRRSATGCSATARCRSSAAATWRLTWCAAL
jgi:DNA-binding NarL/FixJ family response regulator